MRRLAASLALVVAACGGSGPAEPYELPASEAERYDTAFIAVVVADVEGDDLAPDAGEHVVIRTNWDHRTDMGGWAVEDADGNRLPLGIGRQLDPGTELALHTGCGQTTDTAVFACLDTEVWDDDGDVARLLDAGGTEVARFAYGSEAG